MTGKIDDQGRSEYCSISPTSGGGYGLYFIENWTCMVIRNSSADKLREEAKKRGFTHCHFGVTSMPGLQPL